MKDIEDIVTDIIECAAAANRASANRMYEALSNISRGCDNPKIEAELALKERNAALSSQKRQREFLK